MKKIIAIMLVIVIAICCTACASTTEANEVSCPGLIGLNHLEVIKDLNDRYEAGKIKPEYKITKGQIEGYWIVYLEGEVDGDVHVAGGFYDHEPNREEIEILWANKVPEQQFSSLLEGLGF